MGHAAGTQGRGPAAQPLCGALPGRGQPGPHLHLKAESQRDLPLAGSLHTRQPRGTREDSVHGRMKACKCL